jgi:hypothetical protein
MLFTKYYQCNHIKVDEMDRACSIHGRDEYKILITKPERWILEKWYVKVWPGFIWPRIGASDRNI